MNRLTEIITRLNAECPEISGRVLGSSELASSTTESIIPPCAFVMPVGKKYSENKSVGGFLQRVEKRFAVIVCTANYADITGEAANEERETVEAEILAALQDWQPSWAALSIEATDDRIVDYDDSILRWSYFFKTQFYYRKV